MSAWYVVAAAAVSYFSVSAVLLRFPQTIHSKKRKTKWENVIGIAHRGGRDTTPENTLAAFRNAARLVDAVELDIWVTKDNELAVIHDGTLNRCLLMLLHLILVVGCKRLGG
eukprot:m.150739 g.150739  ORF g.150739 m.150739 type:complete len:112 (-) comp15029_c0_seq13:1121-1456(-)